ncbi:MAG: hypothetical protein ACFFB0_14230 [Promethearchaeota archaeon]
MNENRNTDVKLFGFKLNQISSVILFILSLTSLIGYVPTIYRYILDLIRILPINPLDDLIILLVGFIFLVIPFAILFYTLVSCLKWRKYHMSKGINGIKWFGFEMNKTSATILLLISLIGVIGFLGGIYVLIYIIVHTWNRFLDFSRLFYSFIPLILNLIETIILVMIYIYTMQRCLRIKRKIEKDDKITMSRNRNEVKYFRFKLNQISVIILFILALIAVINLMYPIFSSILNFRLAIIPVGILILNLMSFVSLLIFLIIYIYTLVSCLKWRKYHMSEGINGIKWFGFEMNKTSATVLLLISLIGFISFLGGIYGLINNIIFSFKIYDNLYQIFDYLKFTIVSLIGDVITLLIYIYTIRRCLKVRILMK